MEREARQKALAEKKRRLEEIKARRRQPTSTSGGTTTKTTTDTGGSSGLDSYIDDLLNTTAPGLKGLSAADTTSNATASSTDATVVSKEESKAATDTEKKEDESTPCSTENTTQPAPSQQTEAPQTPKVETFEIAIQCMEDDFPPPSLVDEDEEKDDEDGDESSQDGSSAEDNEQRGGQSTSSIMRTTSYEDRTSSTQQTSDIPQPLLLSESEKEKLLSSQPFNTFLSTASKRVERLLGASDMNMYGILNGSGWGVTGSSSSIVGDGSGVSGNGGGVVDFSIDYANDNEDDEEYYDDSDDELADGVSSSATTNSTRRKKRRSKKKAKEEAYQTGGYFNARATYEFPKFTNGRNVTDIEWCPGHKEWVLASYNAVSGSNARDGLNEVSGSGGEGKGTTKGMPSSNPTTRHLNPLDPSSSFLQTSSSSAIPNEGIVAIYNLSMPSRPEHLFCAGCPILHSQFHPTEHPKLILGGGSSGQVLVWDSRVGRYPVQRSANAVTGGGHDCELVGMKVLGNDNNTGGGGAGGLSTSKLVTASSDGKVNYWSVSNLREPIEHVKVNANLSCLEVLHGNTNEGIVCGDERGGLHTILAGTGRDGSSSNKRIIRTLHPGGVVVTADDDNVMDDNDTSAAAELAEMGHYGMVTSVATRPIMPPSGSTPRLGNKETTSELGGSSKGFSRGAGGSQIFKRQVAYEIKMGLAPEDWSHQLWMDYRRELKDRGITTPRNIQDVDDEIIVNHMISKSVKFDEKRDNVGLSKILTRFFELNGNVVSQQKKQRIDFFVTGLTKKQYVTLTNVFGGEEGGLTLNEMKDMRKVIYDVDGLKTVLDAMPSSGTE